MLAARCDHLLQHLLHIEADSAQGQHYNTQKVQWTESDHEDERNVPFITVPYFGTIRFAREGMRSTEQPGYRLIICRNLEGTLL
jgi:hypothetical protein